MPETWRRLSPYELRPGQEEVLGLLASGVDVLARLPTGSGKSLNVFVPAVAKWCAGQRARLDRGGDGPLPPLTVVQARSALRASAFTAAAHSAQYLYGCHSHCHSPSPLWSLVLLRCRVIPYPLYPSLSPSLPSDCPTVNRPTDPRTHTPTD